MSRVYEIVLDPLNALLKASTTADKAKSAALASKNPIFSPLASPSASEIFKTCIEKVHSTIENPILTPEAETTSPAFKS